MKQLVAIIIVQKPIPINHVLNAVIRMQQQGLQLIVAQKVIMK